jgi:hypothetical protein
VQYVHGPAKIMIGKEYLIFGDAIPSLSGKDGVMTDDIKHLTNE